jgi:hypothetical protein
MTETITTAERTEHIATDMTTASGKANVKLARICGRADAIMTTLGTTDTVSAFPGIQIIATGIEMASGKAIATNSEAGGRISYTWNK